MGFFNDRTNYFKSIAHLNKLIAHNQEVEGVTRASFFGMNDEDEVLAACVNWGHFPCMVQFDFSGRYTSNITGEPKRKISNAIWILDKATVTNMASIQAAKDRSFEVIEQVISAMWDDFKEQGFCGNLQYVDLAQFNFLPIGIVGSSLYGWQLNFGDDTQATAVTTKDPEQWYDE